MSRVGKEPVIVPAGVKVDLKPGTINVKGPKGEMSVAFHPNMHVELNESTIKVTRVQDDKSSREIHGTTQVLIANAVHGVTQGFSKSLEIRGVGFQANMQGGRLVLQLGFSHDIYFEPPKGIEIKAQRTEITVSGIDKQLVGEVAAKIRSFKKPEPYKGKGIRYVNEYVRSKQGKTVGSGAK